MNVVETGLRTRNGSFQMVCRDEPENRHPDFALVFGDVRGKSGVLTRVQSECLTGHVFQSLTCDCNEQMQDALARITSEECGVLLYLRQEGRGIGLVGKLRSYILQKLGRDTVDANLELGYEVDPRTYESAAELLKHLGVKSVRLLTNNPKKASELRRLGVEVESEEELVPVVRDENRRYLETKIERMGHRFSINKE
jgi:GTP cyclohydrolase II